MRTLHSRLKTIARSFTNQQQQTNASKGVQAVGQSSSTAGAIPIPFPGAEALQQPQKKEQKPAQPLQAPAGLIAMPPELRDAPNSSGQVQSERNSASGADVMLTDRSSFSEISMSPMMGSIGAPNNGNNLGASTRNKGAQIIRQFKAKAQQVTSSLTEHEAREYHLKLQSILSGDQLKTAQSKQVLLRQQQRLLLLRHAMWCRSNEGSCKLTPSCGEMKRLWAHMSTCQLTNNCPYSHCSSSKYVLSHFQQCTNPKCLVCQLVRFPVEVKEKNGTLMLDTERAMEQIIAAAKLRQQKMQKQQQQAQPNLSAVDLTPGMANHQALQQQRQNMMANATGGAVGNMNINTANAFTGASGPISAIESSEVSSTPTSTTSASPEGTTATATTAIAGASSSGVAVGNLTEEDRQQVLLIQGRVQGWSIEQLSQHCKKLENWAEQMRTQMNALMNECRQLMHQANATQDQNLKSQYMAQASTKRVALKDLENTYRKCNSQYKAVQYTITSRQNGIPIPNVGVTGHQSMMGGSIGIATAQFQQQQAAVLAAQQQAQAAALKQQHLQQMQQMKLIQQQKMKSANSMKPLEMPADLQAQSSTIGSAIPFPTKIAKGGKIQATKMAVAKMSLQQPMKQEVGVKSKPGMDANAVIKAESNALDQASLQQSAESSPVASTSTPTEVPTSVLNEMSNENIEKHIDSLVKQYHATLTPAQLKKKLEGLLKGMMDHKFGWVFSSPVDPLALGIPNYFNIIRRPMDMGTIKKKLDAGIYKQLHHFAADVRLTFMNAMTYNDEDQDVYKLAKDMLHDFNQELKRIEDELEKEEKIARERENACRLCGYERMVFEPAVLYCNGECNSRIRRNCYYYCSEDNKYHCCHPCYANLPDTVKGSEGKDYEKKELTRKKNDEVNEEPWVQCDKCNKWVHQVCALFNGKIENDKKPVTNTPRSTSETTKNSGSKSKNASDGKNESNSSKGYVSNGPSSGPAGTMTTTSSGGEFLCPECLLEWRQKDPVTYKVGKSTFNAKDLMRTKLSDHLERHIQKILKEEREDEAKWTNKKPEEIPSADGLVIRQVSNIEKQLMVRDKMFNRYKDSHKYTSEHRFKSKCLCMFQEIHGVSVLLFGMYVHEFDENEADSNSRRVYISYLDSVNYFEPPHLRTKVYQELLIAYFEFVKQRGFHTAHLWACPPLKGDDYILYCHPESQKTPKSDRLRQWYVDMLIKAQKQGVVWHITNIFDDYWRNDNPACALPYFEGDYWVGLAEELIEKIDIEKPKKAKKVVTKRKASFSGTKKQSKKSSSKKRSKKRRADGSVGNKEGHNTGGCGSETEEDDDIFSDEIDRSISDPLMQKLGEVIEPMKDDFLIVKLQPYCHICNKPVIDGTMWLDENMTTECCLNPKVVQHALCDGCYKQVRKNKEENGSNSSKDALKKLVAKEFKLPEKCTDPDENNDSEFFDTRQAFLSLCQGNHYQFDELRRAKHSSMMALYHIGNPNPNAYVYECNKCTKDIVSGNRWHCNTCPDFDVCDTCYSKEKHDHILECIPTSSAGETAEKQRKLREQRAKNIRLHMQLLVHASNCTSGTCASSNCEKMKELMRHGAVCKQRATGGCTICRRVWALLQLHARQCRDRECRVPRCLDLREHVRKLQLQQQLMDDRRRAAVTEQYRQLQSGGKGVVPGGVPGMAPPSVTLQTGGGDENTSNL
jgi:E1A/CREB-binding protein